MTFNILMARMALTGDGSITFCNILWLNDFVMMCAISYLTFLFKLLFKERSRGFYNYYCYLYGAGLYELGFPLGNCY